MTPRPLSRAVRHATVVLAATVLSLLVTPSAGLATDPSPNTRSADDPYADFIAEAAERFQLPERWIRLVMRSKGAADPHALSQKGAMGLMQIMPKTWDEIRGRHFLGDDPFDPHDNIIAGAAYLRQLYDRIGDPGFMAAYNAEPRSTTTRQAPVKPAVTDAKVGAEVDVPTAVDTSSELPDRDDAAAAKSPAWIGAPLFVGRADPAVTTDPLASEHSPTAVPTSPTVHDLSAIAPQSNGLFVPRSQTGEIR